MEEVYVKVFEHANSSRSIDNKRNVNDLIFFLNSETELVFPEKSIAIYTIIRHSYNYYKALKLFDEAEKILKTYKPSSYIWKVINKYESSKKLKEKDNG